MIFAGQCDTLSLSGRANGSAGKPRSKSFDKSLRKSSRSRNGARLGSRLVFAALFHPAAIASSRELLSRLHQLRATGRIVLQISPESTGIDNLPDLQLEDGDVFIVPSTPATVNVVGSVYDQNSFLFTPNRRVGDYLKMAGGPNRNADKKHIFIIRADGSVVSRTTNSGLWGNTFESARMNPGDTIVVPEKTFKPTVLRGILDWSQLFSQLALGAAAISVI